MLANCKEFSKLKKKKSLIWDIMQSAKLAGGLAGRVNSFSKDLRPGEEHRVSFRQRQNK